MWHFDPGLFKQAVLFKAAGIEVAKICLSLKLNRQIKFSLFKPFKPALFNLVTIRHMWRQALSSNFDILWNA